MVIKLHYLFQAAITCTEYFRQKHILFDISKAAKLC